jgi:hypothetical protein
MTPRGLIKLTAIANNLEAWRDWERTTEEADALGLGDLAAQLRPPSGAGWRKVDKARHALLERMKGGNHDK